MVKDTGEAPGDGSYQPVGLPEPIAVEANSAGRPTILKMRRRQTIAAIEDRWRIDDEWWRKEPISRLYYAVRLNTGQRLIIYHDLTSGSWYRQSY